ncbi:MAG TPA: twin-arginine translocase TatA/TatE family subunit [Acidimicrobiales bacterium]|nr:twin-arginine translocase TatA/TatE family subunit [Acidimicrobiales bacterium]
MDLFSAKFLLLAVVVLVVLGPDKLPSALRTAGRLLSELRGISAGIQAQSRSVMSEAGLAEPIEELRSAARSLRHPTLPAGPRAEPSVAVVPQIQVPAAESYRVAASDVPTVAEHPGVASVGAESTWR